MEKKGKLLLQPWLKKELLLFVSVPMIFQGLFPEHVPAEVNIQDLILLKGEVMICLRFTVLICFLVRLKTYFQMLMEFHLNIMLQLLMTILKIKIS